MKNKTELVLRTNNHLNDITYVQMTNDNSNILNPLVSGACAGIATDLAFFPIDTIKTRLQAKGGFFQNGGYKGIYRGLGSCIIASAPSASLFFITYDNLKTQLAPYVNSPVYRHIIAASFGEIMACTVRVPAEVIKQRTQAKFEGINTSLGNLKYILNNKHILKNLYRGWNSTIIREIPFTMIQFPLYEWLKSHTWKVSASDTKGDKYVISSGVKGALSGMIAGGFAAAVTTPLDVIKTRIMLSSNKVGFFPLLSQLIKEEGWRSLFKGIIPRTCWISFNTYFRNDAMNLKMNIKLKSSQKLIICIFIMRLINSVSIQTFFQADEFYQSLEPAHFFKYGYGYLTWEWNYQLRSSIHPLIHVLGYIIAGEDRNLIQFIPKLINAIIATTFDYSLYGFILNFSKSRELAWIGLVLSLINAFNWFVLTRSFSNNLEACFTALALKYWPWDKKISGNWYICLSFIVLSCIVRPTNAIFWLPLGTWLLFNIKIQMNWIKNSIIAVAAILTLNMGLDYYFYKTITFPYLNFIQFNFIKNLASFYGVAPWHFYLSQALPLMLLTSIPLFIFGLEKNILLVSSISYVFGFSLIKHKEIRFLMPLQPIILYFSARGYMKINRNYIMITGFFINMFVAIFLSNVNERGAIDIINFLKRKDNTSILFLTPCHSFPWQSAFHNRALDLRFLTCEPPLQLDNPTSEELREYRDQSDNFYDNPENYMSDLVQDSENAAEYIVVFQGLESLMDGLDPLYKKERRLDPISLSSRPTHMSPSAISITTLETSTANTDDGAIETALKRQREKIVDDEGLEEYDEKLSKITKRQKLSIDWFPPSVTSIEDYCEFKSTTYFSEVPQEILLNPNKPIVLGVDEAGRGPVLGPMVYGISYSLMDYQEQLKSFGFADSKQLTDIVRTTLFKQIEDKETLLNRNVGWATTTMTAKDISSGMLRSVNGPGAYNLNEQAHDTTIQLIRQTLSRGVKVSHIFVDTVGPPITYQNKLKQHFPGIEIVVCKKADSLYPIVSTASVVAKVSRDLNIHHLNKNIEILKNQNLGSGYPSDPNTSFWLNHNVDQIFGWCFGFIRFSWQTAKDSLMKNGAIEVTYQDDIMKNKSYGDINKMFDNKNANRSKINKTYFNSDNIDLL
ncbi:GPI10 [Candida pseudojiufengensis]|uniref:GPI10 n=1 Tax=Candida pseudojiufengensis TaxID=497109 RepID=UPI0022243010|nr:GPI10 [Candida pseudojiufengensis]KAI5959759.1 GPI10 [Candida pseudojiufengensis]